LLTGVELVIKQLKLTNDAGSADDASEVNQIFSELEELVPKVKDIALSSKRSANASTADCSNDPVWCSSRF